MLLLWVKTNNLSFYDYVCSFEIVLISGTLFGLGQLVGLYIWVISFCQIFEELTLCVIRSTGEFYGKKLKIVWIDDISLLLDLVQKHLLDFFFNMTSRKLYINTFSQFIFKKEIVISTLTDLYEILLNSFSTICFKLHLTIGNPYFELFHSLWAIFQTLLIIILIPWDIPSLSQVGKYWLNKVMQS